MEAENKKARLKAKLRFTLVFAIALIVTTTGRYRNDCDCTKGNIPS